MKSYSMSDDQEEKKKSYNKLSNDLVDSDDDGDEDYEEAVTYSGNSYLSYDLIDN